MERPSKLPKFIFLVSVLLIIAGGIFIYLKGKKSLVSPVPEEPTFKVVFYTPTPEPTLQASTPSATPKVKPTNTPAPKPTAKTPSPTPKASPTATPRITPSPTVKPT